MLLQHKLQHGFKGFEKPPSKNKLSVSEEKARKWGLLRTPSKHFEGRACDAVPRPELVYCGRRRARELPRHGLLSSVTVSRAPAIHAPPAHTSCSRGGTSGPAWCPALTGTFWGAGGLPRPGPGPPPRPGGVVARSVPDLVRRVPCWLCGHSSSL